MPLFTKQFSKDLLLSIFFLFSLYGIINNPISHPTAQPLPGNWSIELRQHPLLFGLAGHNYITLKNQNGEILTELHGLATDPKTNIWKYVGTRETDILKVWKFDGPRKYEADKRIPGILLMEGAKDDILNTWRKGEQCMDTINRKRVLYPPLGITIHGNTENSNSVAYTLTLCMGLAGEHVGWFTPGSQSNLLKE